MNIYKGRIIKAGLLGSTASVLAAMALTTSAAYAQDSQDADAEFEEVVVTGSRIPRKDLIANSPVNVISSEEINAGAFVEVDRVLDGLPQTASSNGPTTNNPGNGQANVNLRNLGTARTLVLVNGRRMVGTATNGVVDLNNIPPALIKQVEVVTGGASAVYGSDAMAGVVNFILKDDFEGVQVNGQYGLSQEGDSERYNADFTLGGNFADGRGNVVIYGNYLKREQTLAGDRDFAAVQLDEFTDDNGDPIFLPGGSSSIPQGRFSGSGGFNYLVDANGSPVAYDGSQHAYNFAPVNNLQLPLERHSIAGLGNYQVTDSINLFAEVMYTNNLIERQLAATPFSESNVDIDLNNPYMSNDLRNLFATRDDDGDGIVQLSIARRMLEAGPRLSEDNHKMFRYVVGLNGELGNGMNWEFFYNYGKSETSQRQDGNIVISRFRAGLMVDPNDPTQCLNPANGCVVLNPFGEGSMTEEMIDYVKIAATNLTSVTQQQVGATIAGSLVELPGGDLGFAAGVEYRKESANTQPDTFLATGDIDGFNAGQPTSGSYDVKEIYLETVVPILSGVAGAQYLGIEAGIRFSDYSTAGGVTSYKIGGEWRPIDDIKVRGLYQHAVRAPNVQELFLGASNSFPGATDFCNDDANRTAAERDFCVLLGVPEGQIDGFQQNDAQIESLLGGNPDLYEETSTTWSVGAVVTPEAIPGLTITADYYSIVVDDAIAALGGGLQGTMDACNQVLDLNDRYCQALSSRRSDGQLEKVPLLNENIARFTAKGVDFSAAYNFDAVGGNFDIKVLGTRFLESITQGSPFVEANDCVGLIGVRTICGRANPKWSFTTRLTYSIEDFSASIRHRYIDSVMDERVAFGTRAAEDTVVPVIPSVNYFDLGLRYKLNENISLFTNVDNMFNKKAPVFGRGVAGQLNTDAGTYDVVGRRFTFGFRANF
ncbi:TonB-dependent receptor domain-containing protein [Kordiimonas sp.]|uniref:TonB-dependent receptor plug domain-containing protein n=1 Tax=Kordiimonas sp. TaxID=1970157 RepID=UPI003A955EC8